MAIVKSDRGEHQHIYGAVGPDGSTMWGEGFKVRKIRYGLYVVEFEKPFKGNPAVVCTIFGGEWETFNLSVAVLEVNPSLFVCGTSSPDRPVDSAFTFIAFGDV